MKPLFSRILALLVLLSVLFARPACATRLLLDTAEAILYPRSVYLSGHISNPELRPSGPLSLQYWALPKGLVDVDGKISLPDDGRGCYLMGAINHDPVDVYGYPEGTVVLSQPPNGEYLHALLLSESGEFRAYEYEHGTINFGAIRFAGAPEAHPNGNTIRLDTNGDILNNSAGGVSRLVQVEFRTYDLPFTPETAFSGKLRATVDVADSIAAGASAPGFDVTAPLNESSPGVYYSAILLTERGLVNQWQLLDFKSIEGSQIFGRPDPPVFVPIEGAYTGSVLVAFGNIGVDIYYTLDGSDPSTESTPFTSPLRLTSTTTVRARAYKAGYPASDLSEATYVIKVASPRISPTSGDFLDSLRSTMTPVTEGSDIYFTLDGSEPTLAARHYTDTVPLIIDSTTLVKARAYKAGMSPSDVTQVLYTEMFPVAAPVISPSSGTFTGSVQVAMTSATTGATIRYTLDGSTPTKSSTIFNGSLVLTTSRTVKARAFKTGLPASEFSSATLTVTPTPAATPVILPPNRTFSGSVQVTMVSPTAGATIRYTLDGSEPTKLDTPYSDPILLNSSRIVKARAFKTGFHDSGVATASFTPAGKVALPEIAPWGGTFADSVQVRLTCATPGATIRYTTNGLDPRESSTLYSGAITLTSSKTVKAKAFGPIGTLLASSDVSSATFTVNPTPTVAKPTISPNGGTHDGPVPLTFGCTTPGTSLDCIISRNATGGFWVDTISGPAPLTYDLTTRGQIRVAVTASKEGYKDSETAVALFSIGELSVAAPAISPNGGDFVDTVLVSLTCDTEGAIIRYTDDGSDPVAGSTPYSGPFPLMASKMIRARGFKDGYTDSAVAEASFTQLFPPANSTNLVISELCPSPLEEFVELLNISNRPVDLTGVRFISGIQYVFGAGTVLNAGERLVLVRDGAAFAAKFPVIVPRGIYAGELNNSGEELRLVDASGEDIRRFTYGTFFPWPTVGLLGFSITLVNPSTNPDPSLARNWRESMSRGGSPGTDDTVPFTGNALGDSDSDGISDLLEYALIGNPVVTVGNGLRLTVNRRAGSSAFVALESSTDLKTWSPLPASALRTFVLHVDGKLAETWEWSPNGSQGFLRARVELR